MKIIRNNLLPPKGYVAMMLFGMLFARHGVTLSERTIRHEEIHKRQMLEMLVLPFYLWYGIESLIRLLQYRNRRAAYRNISFEREAYANDEKETYDREPYDWLDYLNEKDSVNNPTKNN